MDHLLITLRSLLLLVARLLLYMGIALLALAALRIGVRDTMVLLHRLMAL